MKLSYKTGLLSLVCALMLTPNISIAGGDAPKTETFKVSGNCGMCKSKIEGSLKEEEGVASKSWDAETQMLTVSYDPSKIQLKDIKKKVAAVGYDTDEVKATDAAYDELHGCCKYEREK